MSDGPDQQRRGAADVAWVVAARSGDGAAFGELYARWVDRVHDVARNIVRNPDTAAEVAQDAFIVAWQQLDRLEQPEAFGGWLLRITRNRALDRLARENRSTPTDGAVVTDLHDRGSSDPFARHRSGGDTSEVVADLERDDLIDAAAAALGERDASLLDLHLRHGLSPAEIADELGVSPNTAHQQLFRMRARLGSTIGALVLWRSGRPQCPVLATLVSMGDRFDAGVASVVDRHQRSCAECTDRRALLTSPTELFAALPVAVVPLSQKLDIFAALRDAGLPFGDPPASLGAEQPDTAIDDHTTDDHTSDDHTSDDHSSDDPHAAHEPGSDDATSERRGWWWWAAAVAVLIAAIGSISVVVRAATRESGPDVISAPTSPATDPAATGTARSGTAPPPSTTLAVSTTTPALVADTIVPLDTVAVPSGGVATPSATTQPVAPPPPSVATTIAPLPAPPTVPPTLPPTVATTPPPTVATTTTVVPPPPRIVSFTVAAGPISLICLPGTGSPRSFTWSSTLGTSATLAAGASTRSIPPSGSINVCATEGSTATLAVSNAGGSVERSLGL